MSGTRLFAYAVIIRSIWIHLLDNGHRSWLRISSI